MDRFIEIAHEHLVFWEGGIESGKNPLLKTLERVPRLVDGENFIVLQGAPGTDKTKLARAIAEFRSERIHSVQREREIFDCTTDDIAKLKTEVSKTKEASGSLIIQKIDRQDGGVDPILSYIKTLLETDDVESPFLIFVSDSVIFAQSEKDDMQSINWGCTLGKYRPILQQLVPILKHAVVEFPFLYRRPWDIAPLMLSAFEENLLRHMTLNVLDVIMRYPWPYNESELRKTVRKLMTVISQDRCIGIEHLERIWPVDIRSKYINPLKDHPRSPSTPPPARSKWLRTEWLTGESAKMEVAGQEIRYSDGQEILFDLNKMRRFFQEMRVLGEQMDVVSFPAKSNKPTKPFEPYMNVSRDYREYRMFNTSRSKGKLCRATRACKQTKILEVLVRHFFESGDLGMDQREILEQAGFLNPDQSISQSIRKTFRRSQLWGSIIDNDPYTSFYYLKAEPRMEE